MGGILDFRPWKSGFSDLLFDYKIDRVEVGLSLSPPRDLDERASLKLLDEPVDTRNAHSDIFCQAILARKAKVVVSGIAE